MKNILQFLTSQTRKVCWQGYNLTIDSVFSLGEHAIRSYKNGSNDAVRTWLSDHSTLIWGVAVTIFFIILLSRVVKLLGLKRVKNGSEPDLKAVEKSAYRWSVFDLAKTAYEPSHTEAVINLVEKLHYDVNSTIPSNGLTLFLCACLSGKRELINYLLSKGANINLTTKQGDNALYLATFGVLSSANPDVGVLEDLISAGCSVNRNNCSGYTPLHRAASSGNETVIKTLLKHGADPYQASHSGIYPIDCAINAGHLEAAELLKINIANAHVWDVVDPHTPVHIKMGLQSPRRKHLVESTHRITSPGVSSI